MEGEETGHHAEAMLQHQEMDKEFSAASSADVTQYNNIVQKNREMLKTLVDVVVHLLLKEEPWQQRKGCQLALTNCLRSLDTLRLFEQFYMNCIEETISYISAKPKTLFDVTDAISRTIKSVIREEVQAATYVSLILSDHSEISTKPQISAILRYITQGSVVERFVGFVNMDDQKTLDFLFQSINNIVKNFKLEDRFFSISLDGGILVPSELPELIQAIRGKYPYVYFVPWCGHDLDYVLQQSLSNIKECSFLLMELKLMKDFFKSKSRLLKSYLHSSVPTLTSEVHWLRGYRFVLTVSSNRKRFMALFEKIISASEELEAEDVTRALRFKEILGEFRTKFLLSAFLKLTSITNPLRQLLSSRTLNILKPEHIFKIESHKIVEQLVEESVSGFEKLWHEVNNDGPHAPGDQLVKRARMDFNDPEILAWRDLYSSMARLLAEDIKCRFASLNKLAFCALLSWDSSGNFVFSNDLLPCLAAEQGAHFSEEQLINELNVMRRSGKLFAKKSVRELLELFIELKLQDEFKNVYRLCEFVLTLPVKLASKKGESDKFENISAWSYIPEVPTLQNGDISIPCVEREILQDKQKSASFYDELFELFYEQNKTLNLIYK